MIPEFPRWIWGWAMTLAFMAGIMNAVGLMSANHQAVSHLTGVTSLSAIAATNLDFWLLLHFVESAAAFVIGCAVSAWLIRAARWHVEIRHGWVFLLEAAAIFGAYVAFAEESPTGLYLCAFAIGLQNATSTILSGAVLRTSHVTGMFTDLGIALGLRLRGGDWDRRRTLVCAAIIVSFVGGGIAGAGLFAALTYRALWLPCLMAIVLAIFHFAILHRPSPKS